MFSSNHHMGITKSAWSAAVCLPAVVRAFHAWCWYRICWQTPRSPKSQECFIFRFAALPPEIVWLLLLTINSCHKRTTLTIFAPFCFFVFLFFHFDKPTRQDQLLVYTKPESTEACRTSVQTDCLAWNVWKFVALTVHNDACRLDQLSQTVYWVTATIARPMVE